MIGFHLVLPHMKELSESFPNHATFKCHRYLVSMVTNY